MIINGSWCKSTVCGHPRVSASRRCVARPVRCRGTSMRTPGAATSRPARSARRPSCCLAVGHDGPSLTLPSPSVLRAHMIVLDTNVLERHPFESSVMAILKVLSRLTNHKLAISEVTLHERCSHFRNQLQRSMQQQARIGDETEDLLRIANTRHKSWSLGSETEIVRVVDIALGKYQQRLLTTFDVV